MEMNNMSFTPGAAQEQESSAPQEHTDVVAATLGKIARNVLIVVLGIVPIFFIPTIVAPVPLSKTTFVAFGVFAALIFFGLSVLRKGTYSFQIAPGLLAMWAVAAVVVAAGLFSGDLRDSFVGEGLEIQTVSFVILMALIASAVSLWKVPKSSIISFYMVLMGSAIVLGLYHLLRLFFGAGFLSLGSITTPTSSPVGGWNDVALFFGLVTVLALMVTQLFPLAKWSRIAVIAAVGLSLIMMSVVNFFYGLAHRSCCQFRRTDPLNYQKNQCTSYTSRVNSRTHDYLIVCTSFPLWYCICDWRFDHRAACRQHHRSVIRGGSTNIYGYVQHCSW